MSREAYGSSSHKRRPKPLSEEFIMWATDAYLKGTIYWEDFTEEKKDVIDDELWLRKRHRRKAREKKAQEIEILEHREVERHRLARGIEAHAEALRKIQADLEEFRTALKVRPGAATKASPITPPSPAASTPSFPTPVFKAPKWTVPRAKIPLARLTSWSTLVVPAPPAPNTFVLSIDFKGSDALAPTVPSPVSLIITPSTPLSLPLPLLPTLSMPHDPFEEGRKTTCAKAYPRGEPKCGKKIKPYNLTRRHLLRILTHHWDATRKDLHDYFADSRTNLFQ